MLKRARNRMRSREQSPSPRLPWRAIGRLLAVGGAGFATVIVVFWALNQPIRTVKVIGRFQHVSPGEIEQVVARGVHGQGLLTVRLGGVSRAIHNLPWVAAVSVERDWPHGLSVLVIEQVAAARWGGDGLVNSDGVLFATGVSDFRAGLARLSGPDGSEAEVTQRYLAMQRRLLGPSPVAPARKGLIITAVRLDARGAWQLDLANGITVRLGRSQVDDRFEKFVTAALGVIEQRAADISHVDMRYTNGFSIAWRASRAQAALGNGSGRHGFAACGERVARDGHPGLARSMECAAQSPAARPARG